MEEQIMTRILIVDDKPENLYLLQAMLDSNDFKTIIAKNGAEALGLLRNNMPDLIISDILMPVMDGFTLCKECKKDEKLKNIPFFFYTATYTDTKDEEYALSLGADRFILKPQEPDNFLKIIYDFMEDVKNKKIQSKEITQSSETIVLKEYNEVLIRKIEDKMLQTQKNEKDLKSYSEKLENEIRTRQEKEEILRKSEEYNRLLFNTSPIGLALCRMDRSLVDINPAYAKILGRTVEDTLKLSYWDITPEKYAAQEEEQLKNLEKTGHYGLYEKEYIHKDGHLVPVLLQGLTIERDGECFIWSTVENITERKEAEIALQKSQHLFQTLAEVSPVGIFRTTPEGETTYVNPKWTELSGLTLDEALGDKWLKAVHPEDQTKIIENWNSDIKSQKLSNAEYRFLRDDGTIVWVMGNAVPEWDEDQIIGYIGTITDFTERKRLEVTQEALVKISNAVLSSQNIETFFRFIFTELQEIINTSNFYIALYDEETQMISTPFIADQLDEDLKGFPVGKSMTGYVIKNNKSMLINQEDMADLRKKGVVEMVGPPSEVWIGVPLFVKESVTGAIVIQNYEGEKILGEEELKILEYIAPQISLAIERKKTFEDLKVALGKAQESDSLKSAFLANMSHEIRTPMNGIFGFAGLLKEPGLTGEEQQEYISLIEKGGERMLNIINNIVSISKIESGQMEINIQESNINEQIQYIYTFFKPQIEEKGMQFLFRDFLPSNKAILKTDQEKFYAILTNLVNNAVKYTEKGFIEIGYYKRDNYLEFYVKDTGLGIPRDRQNAIFERFIQADISDKMALQGAGLGLSISKAYIEMLGGRIWVDSEEGVGSTFYFTLPYQINSEEKLMVNNFVPVEGKEYNIRNLKILIAEDDEATEILISIIVKKFCIEALKARTGKETVEICRKNSDINLILMDIQMPDMNGYEATRQIRQFNKEVIIIAQTAFGLTGDREKSIEAGCNEYITKPIITDKLLALIQKYFKKYSK